MGEFKDYAIIRELGKGGMAKVLLVQNLASGENFALKKFFRSNEFNTGLSNEQYSHLKKRFIEEAKKLQTLNHPHIVRVYDFLQDDSDVGYVMDYHPNGTLSKWIKQKGTLENKEIKKVVLSILSATAYIHEKGIIHRDIKPDNVLVGKNGKFFLSDFGIAKSLENKNLEYTATHFNAVLGTKRYMPPEQIIGAVNATAQSDIYSIGVLLWELVTCKRAYDYPSYLIEAKIVEENLPLTNTVWDNFIQCATAKSASSRYISATAFVNSIHDKTTPKKKDNSIPKLNLEEGSNDEESDLKMFSEILFGLWICGLFFFEEELGLDKYEKILGFLRFITIFIGGILIVQSIFHSKKE